MRSGDRAIAGSSCRRCSSCSSRRAPVNTVLSAALKDVALDLRSSEATLAWAITAPFLAIGIGNPIFGRLGDIRSRRRMYLIGVAVFAVCTGGAALAHSSAALIATRAGAGIGTAIAMPNGMAMVLGYFAREERARARVVQPRRHHGARDGARARRHHDRCARVALALRHLRHHRHRGPRLRAGVPLRDPAARSAQSAIDRHRRQPHARHRDAGRDAGIDLHRPLWLRESDHLVVARARADRSSAFRPHRTAHARSARAVALLPPAGIHRTDGRVLRRPHRVHGRLRHLAHLAEGRIRLHQAVEDHRAVDPAPAHVRARVTGRRPLRRALRWSSHCDHGVGRDAGVDGVVRRDDAGRIRGPARRGADAVGAVVRSRHRAVRGVGRELGRTHPTSASPKASSTHRSVSAPSPASRWFCWRSAVRPCTAATTSSPLMRSEPWAAAMLAASFLLSDQRRSKNST